jgi:uncharacterized protein with GYD domain
MAKYLMLGRYSAEAVKGITADRTKKVAETIKKASGKIESMHALLGRFDLAFIVDFPSMQDAMKASVTLARSTGISFTTLPAVTVEEFDKLAG